jgi:hypothetical protein
MRIRVSRSARESGVTYFLLARAFWMVLSFMDAVELPEKSIPSWPKLALQAEILRRGDDGTEEHRGRILSAGEHFGYGMSFPCSWCPCDVRSLNEKVLLLWGLICSPCDEIWQQFSAIVLKSVGFCWLAARLGPEKELHKHDIVARSEVGSLDMSGFDV